MADDALQKARRALEALEKELDRLEKARGKPGLEAPVGAAAVRRRRPTKTATAAVVRQQAVLTESLTSLFGTTTTSETGVEPTSFPEFFKEVGVGLVEAQKRMDDASRQYLAGVSGQRFLQPSIFRIPKLTAQMRFALEKKKSEGFALFFNREDTQSHQQSVEFEVVSAPPPSPGHAAPFLYEPVLAPDRRAAVLESLRKAGGIGVSGANAARVLILANEAGSQYLILHAETSGKCGVWFLLDDAQSPVLVTLRGPAGGVDGAAKAIAAQGDAQAAFLKNLE